VVVAGVRHGSPHADEDQAEAAGRVEREVQAVMTHLPAPMVPDDYVWEGDGVLPMRGW